MAEQEKHSNDSVWERIGALEKSDAAKATDIRGIYGALDEIRDVLVRMQENARPNLGGMFLVLLATCTFLVTIGGLTMAPIYREQARTSAALVQLMKHQNDMALDRFTNADGAKLEDQLITRMRENENTFYATRERVARMEGALGIGKHDWSKSE